MNKRLESRERAQMTETKRQKQLQNESKEKLAEMSARKSEKKNTQIEIEKQ